MLLFDIIHQKELKQLTSISNEITKQLHNKRNLLAFSAGIDSSALFFLLIEHKIPFDIALVNYNLRDEAKHEEAYAIELAKTHNLKSHITHAPQWQSNFEKNARDFRYNFFDTLMTNYDNLLTAHQLNDQLEWFLMRFTKGAGTSELMGLESISQRKNYTLIRPLLNHSKEDLLNYLHQHQHHYFVDKSNQSDKYERNRFRKNFSDKLLTEYQKGIQHSFKYLKEDKKALLEGVKEIFHEKELYIIEYKVKHQKVRIVDKYLKKLGYLLSAQQRKELVKKESMVMGGLWSIECIGEKIFIAPYRAVSMPKPFKEECRTLRIPSKIRAYLYAESINPKALVASY